MDSILRMRASVWSGITASKITFDIDNYLGGDWKLVTMCTGVDSATSTYACIWCHCPAAERHLSDAE